MTAATLNAPTATPNAPTTATLNAPTGLTTRERLRELDRNGEFPPSWRPNPGDEVEGEILRYSETELPLSGPCPIAVLGQADGEPISVFLMGAVLKGEFEKKDPKVGECVLIRYLGKHEQKGYKRYVVHVHREEEEVRSFHQAIGRSSPPPSTGAAPANPDPQDPFSDEDPGAAPYARQVVR